MGPSDPYVVDVRDYDRISNGVKQRVRRHKRRPRRWQKRPRH